MKKRHTSLSAGSWETASGHAVQDPAHRSRRRNLRALVADPSAVSREWSALQFSQLGISAEIVATAREASIIFGDPFYDIVLIDCRLLDRDVYRLAKDIRGKNRSIYPLPIIAMSSRAADFDRLKGSAAGISGFLSRPLDPSALAKLIDDACPVIHAGFLKEMRLGLGDPEVFEIMLRRFIRSYDYYRNQLAKTIELGQASRARKLAHTLKGNAGMFGAFRLGTLAERIELDSRMDRLSGAARWLKPLDEEFSRVLEIIDGMIVSRSIA